ncbi:MAG: hypothetical protein ACSW8D_03180 [Prevotella sp.]
MNISWGKIAIDVRQYKSTAYGSSDTFTRLSIPVEGSTNINVTAGDTKKAKQEGGEDVDSKTGANSYELVWKLFVKKTDATAYPAILDAINGVVNGEFDIRVVPVDDSECYGAEMPRATVNCIENFTSEEGITLEYHATGLLDDAASSVAGHYGTGRIIELLVFED